MLIYEKIDEKHYVTQVIFGFNKNKTTRHNVNVDKLTVQYHKDEVKKLEPGGVFVTGDSSILNGGHHPRKVYQHLLDSTAILYNESSN